MVQLALRNDKKESYIYTYTYIGIYIFVVIALDVKVKWSNKYVYKRREKAKLVGKFSCC